MLDHEREVAADAEFDELALDYIDNGNSQSPDTSSFTYESDICKLSVSSITIGCDSKTKNRM
jgi:hypothetical protein